MFEFSGAMFEWRFKCEGTYPQTIVFELDISILDIPNWIMLVLFLWDLEIPKGWLQLLLSVFVFSTISVLVSLSFIASMPNALQCSLLNYSEPRMYSQSSHIAMPAHNKQKLNSIKKYILWWFFPLNKSCKF